MNTWTIGQRQEERLSVTVLSRAAKEEGYDWVSARASIDVGGFRGDVALTITLSDMVRFAGQLRPVYETLKGQAEFRTIEDQLFLKLTIDHLGHVSVGGHLRDQAGIGNKLEFKLELDQSFLKGTLAELNKAIETARQ
jgi:hypothetical protein